MNLISLETIEKKAAQLAEFAQVISTALADVDFEPSDMESIETAFQEIADAIDGKSAVYEQNIWIQDFAGELKEEIRKTLLEREIETRISG